MSRYGVFISAFSAVACLALATAVDAAVLVDFKPDPVSSALYEIGWTKTALVQRPGSVGNGDGTLDPRNQTPGGLNIQTPLKIVGVPGGVINTADSSTTFYDVTLQISGLEAAAAAQTQMIMPGMVLVYQPVGAGTFTLLSTDPGTGPTVLLTGSLSDAVIVGLQGQTTGSIQSSHVTYMGGAIYTQLISQGGRADGGSLSWSLLDVGGGLNVVTGGGFGMTLDAFGADMTGQFNSLLLPEPATLCLMGAGVAVVLISRRRK